MVERAALKKKIEGGGAYYPRRTDDIAFCPTGSKLLDLALGGGWAERRIANIVGDRSSGKTLLAMEAGANFIMKYKDCYLYYRESEAAFLKSYASTLGLPISKIDFGTKPLETVEELFEDMLACTKRSKNKPGLYILDSLDALSDSGELDRSFHEATYGTAKARQMSKLFRMLVRDLSKSNLTVLIISQVRDKIGATFGRKTTRSGGRALDFYCSQIIYLAQTGTRARTIEGQRRPVAVSILAKVDKNKVAMPFREAKFEIQFGFGIDDVNSCLSFMKESRALPAIDLKNGATDESLRQHANKIMQDGSRGLRHLHNEVEKRWRDIELKFMPKVRKYHD